MMFSHSFFGSFGDLGGFAFHFRETGPFWRRFYTREERIAQLEKYKEQLEKELKAVNETIEELRQGG